MRRHARAFGVSLGVHAVVFTCIIAAGMIVPKNKTVLLDFSIADPLSAVPVPVGRVPAQEHHVGPVQKHHVMKAVAPTTEGKKAAPLQRANQREKAGESLPTAEGEKAAPLQQEKTKDVPDSATGPLADTKQNVNADSTNASPASNSGTEEAVKARYVSAQFVHIRDRILKSLSYPMVAREMGWSGKVTVSFTVREDGSVEDIGIVKGSGFAVLDNNAVETIKKCCPLPKPPVKTALLMPIVYRLQ